MRQLPAECGRRSVPTALDRVFREPARCDEDRPLPWSTLPYLPIRELTSPKHRVEALLLQLLFHQPTHTVEVKISAMEDKVVSNAEGTRRRRLSRFRGYLLPLFAVTSVVLVLFVVLAVRGSGEVTLVGTDLDKQAAPDFTLTDQRGQTVSLSDFRGKAVVLTFIYTNCPDVCPAIARNLGTTYELLREETQDDVVLIAVTLDPTRDTQAALQEFSALHGLADNPNWYALRGEREVLEPVWQAYGIYAGEQPAPGTPHHDQASPETTRSETSTPVSDYGQGHTDAIYVIDPEGRQRVFLRSGIDPSALAANLEALVE